jgi:hypothetical protein
MRRGVPYSRSAAILVPRLDHLGNPAGFHAGRKFKYAHSITVRFDQRPPVHSRHGANWQLWQDAVQVGRISLGVLARMRDAFSDAIQAGSTVSPSHALVDAALFRYICTTSGRLRSDRVLVRRLFDAFSGYGRRLDYRSFLLTLACACDAPAEDKFEFLLAVCTATSTPCARSLVTSLAPLLGCVSLTPFPDHLERTPFLLPNVIWY